MERQGSACQSRHFVLDQFDYFVDLSHLPLYHSAVQLIGELLLTFAFIVPALGVTWVAVVATVRVWQGDIGTEWLDPRTFLRRRVEETTARFVREPDAIYQDEKIVGKVQGAVTVDEAAKRVTFEMIIRAEPFDKRRPFVFGRYRLQIQGSPSDAAINITASGEPTGRTLDGVQCAILRPA